MSSNFKETNKDANEFWIYIKNACQHLHVARERWHDVDVEAGHLVQAVEHHRVLPGQDRDGNWAVAERKVGNEHPNRRSEDLRAKLALNQAAPKLEVGGARRVCVMTEICMK